MQVLLLYLLAVGSLGGLLLSFASRWVLEKPLTWLAAAKYALLTLALQTAGFLLFSAPGVDTGLLELVLMFGFAACLSGWIFKQRMRLGWKVGLKFGLAAESAVFVSSLAAGMIVMLAGWRGHG